jgi:hypothetical protein
MKSVLDQHFHYRIINDRDKICAVAGISNKHLEESMRGYCGPRTTDWVKHFNRHEAEGSPGLLITYAKQPGTIFQAIAGALVRHYIDARVKPLDSVLAEHDEGADLRVPHVLLIPNLFVHGEGATLPRWRIRVLRDLLLARTIQSRTNVLYVESLEGLKSAYGQPFTDYLAGYTIILGAE